MDPSTVFWPFTVRLWGLFGISMFALILTAAPFCSAPACANPLTASALAQTVSELKEFNKGTMRFFVLNGAPKKLIDISFKDAVGRTVRLSDWKGKAVLLNIWATWCVPCRREMPALDVLQSKLGDSKFEVVAISVDGGDMEKPRKFLSQLGIKALSLYADPSKKVSQDLRAFGLPVTILVNHQGEELGWYTGEMEWASQDAFDLIQGAKQLIR